MNENETNETENQTTETNPIFHLPRPELTETAFRRFEEHIARVATNASYTFQPTLFPSGQASNRKRMTASTFISRLRDAILGYKQFKYISTRIIRGVDLSSLTYYRNSDGSVTVENEQIKRGHLPPAADPLSQLLHAKNQRTILELVTELQKDTTITGTSYDVHYDTDQERDWVLSVAGTLAQDMPDEKVVNLMKLQE